MNDKLQKVKQNLMYKVRSAVEEEGMRDVKLSDGGLNMVGENVENKGIFKQVETKNKLEVKKKAESKRNL